MTDAEADLKVLGLANQKRKFAISVTYVWSEAEQSAFERGIDNEWFTLVDLSFIATPVGRGQLMRIFRLTDAGMSRLAELGKQLRQ